MTDNAPTAAPLERLVRHVLSNLASGVAKMDYAPASAGTHFDSAISELAKATDWRPADAELGAIIDDAMKHMEFYGKCRTTSVTGTARATTHKPSESIRDCSSGPRVITQQVTIWAKGDETECRYCWKKAVYDGSRWTHADSPREIDEE